jgi:peptidoglycan/LPS O-acetylase OafA/YrhL
MITAAPALSVAAVSWSLVYEFAFYTAVACIIVAPRRVVATLLAALCTTAIVDYATPWHLWVYTDPMTLEFGLGVLIAYIVGHGFYPSRPRVTIFAAALLFAIGGYLASPGQFFGFPRVATYGLGSALLIYTGIASELNGASFPRWLQYSGAISYSLYISHHLLPTWGEVRTIMDSRSAANPDLDRAGDRPRSGDLPKFRAAAPESVGDRDARPLP